jgi:hypothetical protein
VTAMANEIQQEKIYSKTGLAAGASQTITWKNPPQQTPLSFWAAANPPTAAGPHGTSHGAVEITAVVHHYDRDNYNGDRHSVDITVKNVGATVTGYDVWMTWLTAS